VWQEYKDVSVWYGITGYIVATGTGAFRIYIDNHIFKSHKNISSTMVAPFYNGNQIGLGMILNLK